VSRHRPEAGHRLRAARGRSGSRRSWLRVQVGGTTVSALALMLLLQDKAVLDLRHLNLSLKKRFAKAGKEAG